LLFWLLVLSLAPDSEILFKAAAAPPQLSLRRIRADPSEIPGKSSLLPISIIPHHHHCCTASRVYSPLFENANLLHS